MTSGDVILGVVFLFGWCSMLAQSDVYNAARHRTEAEHTMHVRMVDNATTIMFVVGLVMSLPIGIYFMIRSWKIWLLWTGGGAILYSLGVKRAVLALWVRILK